MSIAIEKRLLYTSLSKNDCMDRPLGQKDRLLWRGDEWREVAICGELTEISSNMELIGIILLANLYKMI